MTTEVSLPLDPAVLLAALAAMLRALLLGGVLFVLCVARPLAWLLGDAGARVERDAARIAGWSAQALVLIVIATLLRGRTPASLADPGFLRLVAEGLAAWLLALLLATGFAPGVLLLPLAAVVLAAAALAADAPAPVCAVLALHLLGAAAWLGGLPCCLAAFARLRDGVSLHAVGTRFARLAIAGGAALALSGAALAWLRVGGPDGGFAAASGTAYGLMLGAKTVLLLGLLALGLGKLGTLRRLGSRPGTPVARLRRLGEAQLGLGLALFVAAAALATLPPPADPLAPRLDWPRVLAQFRPPWPSLANPFAEPADASAIVPVAATPPPDAAGWSANDRRWCGAIVLAIGLLALLEPAGIRPARHWPLLLAALGGLLFLRADPLAWPLGRAGLGASLADPGAAPERLLAAVLVLLGLAEWRPFGAGAPPRGGRSLVLPLAAGLGGAGLLASVSGLAPDAALLAWARLPPALLGLAAAAARWLDLRREPYGARRAAWVWPACVVLIGLLLLTGRPP